MVSVLIYAIGITAILWYTLYFLPYPELTRNFGFALNIVQWGIVSLLSFLAYRQERHYRSVFFQFWIFFAILSLTAPITYHFYHWTKQLGGTYAYLYLMIIMHALVVWVVANILFTYLFRDEKRKVVNLLTTAVVLPVCLWLFWPYYWDPSAVLTHSATGEIGANYRPVEISIIWVNSLALLILLAFFVHKLRTDKPIGAYADTILFIFGLVIAVDMAEYLSAVTEIQTLNISQWALSLLAASMIVTLMLRLKFKSQTIAGYYESQCLSDNPDIDRRVGVFDRFIVRCFFDPEKVGEKVFLGTGRTQVRVKRTSSRVPESNSHTRI